MLSIFRIGDLVQYRDSDVRGIVVGHYDSDRCKVLSKNGHEWLLKSEELDLVKREISS